MAAKMNPPQNFNDLARRYAEGESVKALGAEVGVARHVFRRWLIEAGHHTRGRSEAMFAMSARMTKAERLARTSAAHMARRIKPDPRSARLARARAGNKVVGFGERELLEAVRVKGWPVGFQVRVDVYNVDIVIWGRVAVEPCAAATARKHTLRKIPYLIEAGFVPVVVTQAARIPGMLEDLISFLELFKGKPAAKGQYWVIGCTSNGPRLRLHNYERPAVEAPVHPLQA